MNLFNVLIYLNRISLIIFFGLIVFIGYQIYLIKKEGQKEGNNIIIPDFDEKNFQGVKNYTNLNESLNKNKLIKKENNQYIYFLAGLSFLVLILFFLINAKIKSLEENNLDKLANKSTLLINKNQLTKEEDKVVPTKNVLLSTQIIPSPLPTIFFSPTTNPTKEIIIAYVSPTTSDIIITPTKVFRELSPTTSKIINQLPTTSDLRSIYVFIGSLSLILLAFLF